MSENSFEIKVVSDTVEQSLAQLEQRGKNLRPALLDWAEWAKDETDQRFNEQGDWYSIPWQPNAPATLAAYLRSHGGRKNYKKDGKLSKAGERRLGAKRILQVDGNLRRAAFSYAASADELRFGPWGNGLDAYAAIQHLGGWAGRGLSVYLPARPYLPVDEDGQLAPRAEAELALIVSRHLEDG
ncbi:virion morphogenesis protein [Chromobacterium haemolyticum]|uniref:Virion morphogenesis protein n=1 Tax=Chromobacterium fluminis TaxID=3044269 RepID=A0ABX0L3W5_9NEIS|nr:phage virion morphogenesis protein [Chromobacterium haemolyticum]NHR06519.1 virion morphogenesis protein [Chromobacterium haemolyticum]